MPSMKEWLSESLFSCSLPEDVEGYVLGRGVQESRIRDLGMVLWQTHQILNVAPDPVFANWKTGMGPRGDKWQNMLVTPLYSPRGDLIGLEARAWDGLKRLNQFLLPEAEWNPVFIGLTPTTMQRIWEGASVWIVEGVFDMGPLERVVPPNDVVLATLRARLSPRHVEFLRRFCRGTVYMVYDNDETGRKQVEGWVDSATGKRRWGAMESLSRVGVRARDVRYSGGKDPGEIWENAGLMGLRKAFKDVD